MKVAEEAFMIGPSTGWLYKNNVYSLKQQEAIFKKTNANSLEIALIDWDSNDKRILSLKKGESFDSCTFIFQSLHLPDYSDQEPEYQLALTRQVVARCGSAVAVLHPLKVRNEYPIKYYRKMIARGIPLAIENMDSDNDDGFRLKDLEGIIKDTDCNFVFDVQHAYEHDPKMIYAEELLDSLKSKLVCLHISGETQNNRHSMVYKATNADAIIGFVRRVLSVKNVPLIIEGEYRNSDELYQEIEFLRRELSAWQW